MAIAPEIKITSSLVETINESIEQEIGRRFDEQIEILKRSKPEIVAGILLNITSHMSMHNRTEEVVLTIRKES